MTSKKTIPPEALDKLKAVRELTLRGVGGEKENARRIYRRKLAEHGHTEESFEGGLRTEERKEPPVETLPANLRTVYVSGEVTVRIVAGRMANLVREGACGVEVRGGSITLCGGGSVTVTLTEPFRTLYASGSGLVSVSGFSFKDVGFHLSGAGGLTVSGEAVHATLAPSGAGVVDATGFVVRSLKITASGKSAVKATCRMACITATGHAGVRVTATQSAAVTADTGAKVVILDCPVAGRRPSGPGRVRWQ
jgi:hypothetical protein